MWWSPILTGAAILNWAAFWFSVFSWTLTGKPNWFAPINIAVMLFVLYRAKATHVKLVEDAENRAEMDLVHTQMMADLDDLERGVGPDRSVRFRPPIRFHGFL